MQTTAGPLDIVEIPISKIKIVLLLIGSLLFVAGGIFLVKNPGTLSISPLLITIAGYLGILFFGVIALFIVNKLFNTGPGFVIDDNGIVDNSSAFSVGFIPWEDVVDVSVIEVSGQKLINIKVSDPVDYIKRQPNILAKQTAATNQRMYGTPINVSANSLQVSFDELYNKIKGRWQQNIPANSSSSSTNSLSPSGNADAPTAGL